MKLRIAVLLTTTRLLAQQDGTSADLDRVARTASAMVDGDICRRIQTPRSAQFLLQTDARDPWRAADNFDVNDAAFIQTKKTLIRLSRLCASPCDVSLWMPVPSDPPRIQILIRNAHEISQFWKWGDLHQEMPPEMARVLATRERSTVRRRPGMISVLAPVFDSLGDAIGLVEVVSQSSPDPRENVK